MQVDYKEITKEEAKEIAGGTTIFQFIARVVDTLLDISDDFENNGSNRPFQQYE